MTDIAQNIKKSNKENSVTRAITKPTKSDEKLMPNAKERIMRLQKIKENSIKEAKANIKTNKKMWGKANNRGVVYLGHIPHGFYEEELRGFFSQFGQVSRVKVSRSSKTGKSKGYAFIEFAFNDVAKIVAETMNNYLMFERLVKAQYIPPEKVHSEMFPIRFMTPECYPTLVRRNRMMVQQEKPSTERDIKNHARRTKFKFK